MGRPPCVDKANVKSGPWSPEEDTALKNFVQTHGIGGNWSTLPHKAGLNRCGKSCRLRWLNYLRPDIKHGGFSQEEDNIIFNLFNNMGSRWSVIASQLPGRTDNGIKNHWNTKLKKKYFNNSIQLPSQVSPTKPADQPNYYYSFSSSSTSPSLNDNNNNISWPGGDEEFDSFLMQDFGFDDELLNSFGSAGPSSVSSSLANFDNNNNISWSGGDEEFDSLLMQDFEFDDELLNSFEFQDK